MGIVARNDPRIRFNKRDKDFGCVSHGLLTLMIRELNGVRQERDAI
ncbi:hypothetical protein ACVWZV_009327 [Bradyrhizobium sp. GM5.1]